MKLPARLLRDLERPVRGDGTGHRENEDRRAGDPAHHFLLLYLNFRRITETLIVMLSVPFALVGGVWLMWLLGYNLSVAVAVGFIALAGVAGNRRGHADLPGPRLGGTQGSAPGRRTGTDDVPTSTPQSWKAPSSGFAQDDDGDRHHGGLLPIMWGTGTGSEVMSRIAAPMVGGMVSSTTPHPGRDTGDHGLVKERELARQTRAGTAPSAAATGSLTRAAARGGRPQNGQVHPAMW